MPQHPTSLQAALEALLAGGLARDTLPLFFRGKALPEIVIGENMGSAKANTNPTTHRITISSGTTPEELESVVFHELGHVISKEDQGFFGKVKPTARDRGPGKDPQQEANARAFGMSVPLLRGDPTGIAAQGEQDQPGMISVLRQLEQILAAEGLTN